jgi:choline dehydrogenase
MITGGTVKLASSNPFDAPLIDPNYLSHPFDMQAITEGIRIAKRWYSGPAWDGFLTGFLGPDPDNSTQPRSEFENAFKASVDGFLHAVGTAAMSAPGSKKGVVDNKLKVKGVNGLRVVDASAIVSGHSFLDQMSIDFSLAICPNSTFAGIGVHSR